VLVIPADVPTDEVACFLYQAGAPAASVPIPEQDLATGGSHA
jgi:hypothetical protein